MLTWEKFLERKGCDAHTLKAAGALEDMEEKLGKDLDADDEKGEPAEHKKKILDKKE
jgi:hypothetical protein